MSNGKEHQQAIGQQGAERPHSTQAAAGKEALGCGFDWPLEYAMAFSASRKASDEETDENRIMRRLITASRGFALQTCGPAWLCWVLNTCVVALRSA